MYGYREGDIYVVYAGLDRLTDIAFEPGESLTAEPVADGRLRIRFRITDPAIYAKPWETQMTYHHPKGVEVVDDVCPDRIARGEPAIARPEAKR